MNISYTAFITSTLTFMLLSPRDMYGAEHPIKSVLDVKSHDFLQAYKNSTRRRYTPSVKRYTENAIILLEDFFEQAITHEDITLYRVACATRSMTQRQRTFGTIYFKMMKIRTGN